MKTTLTERGQTAVPAQIRKQFNLKSGQKLEWIADGQIIYVTPRSDSPIKAFRGSSKGKNLTKILLEMRAEDAER